jgi:hypothetical protein
MISSLWQQVLSGARSWDGGPMAETVIKNRRVYPRIVLRVKGTADLFGNCDATPDTDVPVMIEDMSVTGALISCGRDLQEGQRLMLHYQLSPDAAKRVVRGKIVRRIGPNSYGVNFCNRPRAHVLELIEYQRKRDET